MKKNPKANRPQEDTLNLLPPDDETLFSDRNTKLYNVADPEDPLCKAMDLLAAQILSEEGRFKTTDEALAWLADWQKRTRQNHERIVTSRSAEKRQELAKLREKLMNERREIIPPGSDLDQKITTRLRKTITSPKAIESILRKYQQEREALKKELARVKRDQELEQYAGPPDKGPVFRLPSDGTIAFAIMTLFAPNPGAIPLSLINKLPAKRTKKDQEKIDQFCESMFKTEDNPTLLDENGRKINPDQKVLAFLKDTPLRIAKTEIPAAYAITKTPINMAVQSDRESMASLLIRAFSPAGLRHWYGILIALDEAYAQNGRICHWNVNEHLGKRLKLKKNKGAFKREDKQNAIDILEAFCTFPIKIINKSPDGNSIKFERHKMLNYEGDAGHLRAVTRTEKGGQEIFSIDFEEVLITGTQWFYQNAFKIGRKKQGAAFTTLLKQIATENPKDHAMTLMLAGMFVVQWRMKLNKFSLAVTTILKWLNRMVELDPQPRRRLVLLEEELDYMVKKGYLGLWTNNTVEILQNIYINKHDNKPKYMKGDFVSINEQEAEFYIVNSMARPAPNIKPSGTVAPWDCKLTFYSTKDAIKRNKQIAKNRDTFTPTPKIPKRQLTLEQLKEIIKASQLNVKQFAEILGYQKQYFYQILNGKKKISRNVIDRIYEQFGENIPPDHNEKKT